MDYTIVKSMISGVHLAVYSTIKPGALHRLRVEPTTDHILFNIVSVTDFIVDATEIGEKVRRGDLAATSLKLGRFLGKCMREAYRWNMHHVYPDFFIPQVIYATVISHANPDSVIKDSGKIRRSLGIFLGSRNWREIKYFIDTLKSIHRADMYEHLILSGITHVGMMETNISFHDVFRVLGSKWPGFLSLDLNNLNIFEYVKKLLEYYRRYNDANNAVIALYLDMIYPKLPKWAKEKIDMARKDGLMASREGSKKLFEVDLKLRKHGISYNEYIGLLAVIVGLGVYEGIRL